MQAPSKRIELLCVLAAVGFCLAAIGVARYLDSQVGDGYVPTSSATVDVAPIPNRLQQAQVANLAAFSADKMVRQISVPESLTAPVAAEVSLDGKVTETIASIALARDGELLIATDGYSLGDGKPDIWFFYADDFTPLGQIRIDTDLLWTWHGVVLTPDRRKMIVCDRVYNLADFKEEKRLETKGVVESGNIIPEPLAVSPDGKLAVLFIHSYSSADMSLLGLWNLETGKFLRKLDVPMSDYHMYAIFLDDDRVLVWQHDGDVLIVKAQVGSSFALRTRVSGSPMSEGQNLSMSRIGENLVAFSGSSAVEVVDLERDAIVFKSDVLYGNAMISPEGNLIVPTFVPGPGSRVTKPQLSDGRIVLRVWNPADWTIVRDIRIDKPFKLFAISLDGETIYAVGQYDRKVFKIPVPKAGENATGSE